uniref:Nanos-type domain-containing protein n=1 Tax=Gouania willdenowi TaxID=441366 RepID=A0A8C5DDZ9_GOUWI
QMDLFLDAPSPYDYTFNFWNDYLGLSSLVSQTKTSSSSWSPNSITESLKATLGLEDDSPVCSTCVITHCRDSDAHTDCSCSCSPQSHISFYQLQERISGGADSPPTTGFFPGLDLISAERRRKVTQRVCVFCRNNGAPEEVYGTHVLKSADGRVLCPILRAYTCPLCSARGDNAHTIKYCPLSREQPTGHRAVRGGRAPGNKRLKMF